MRLIIDIPEGTYKEVIEQKDTSNTNIYSAIENGTPFDSIIEDIKKNLDIYKKYGWKEEVKVYIEVMAIIDKHIADMRGGNE